MMRVQHTPVLGLPMIVLPRPPKPADPDLFEREAWRLYHAAGPSIRSALRATGLHFDVAPHEILIRRRFSFVVRARNVAMIVVRERFSFSLPEIARRFGMKEHSSVCHALRQSARFAEHVAAVRSILDQSGSHAGTTTRPGWLRKAGA